MQCDSGLLGWLKVPFLYNAFQAAVGATALRRRLIENHVRAKPGDKVIDIGCGSAPTLQSLPDVEYVGLDINPDCIALAQRTYGNRGTFIVGNPQSVRGDSRFKAADIVIAVGVLHHLDDEEAESRLKADLYAMRHVGLQTRGRFRSTSCLPTEVEIFEQSSNTVSLRQKLSKKFTHG